MNRRNFTKAVLSASAIASIGFPLVVSASPLVETRSEGYVVHYMHTLSESVFVKLTTASPSRVHMIPSEKQWEHAVLWYEECRELHLPLVSFESDEVERERLARLAQLSRGEVHMVLLFRKEGASYAFFAVQPGVEFTLQVVPRVG